MPRLELTFPEGALNEEAKAELPSQMARAMLSWEGAPDTEFFRSISWTHLHEMPAGSLHTADGPATEPQFIVDVTVPSGALSERRREGLVKELSELVAEAAGVPAEQVLAIWVLVNEVPDGNWGAGGQVIRFEALREAAKAEREQAAAPS